MRRVALAIFSTVTGLVMLLSFKTHSSTSASVPVAVSGTDSGSGSSGASTPTAVASNSAPASSTPASAAKTVTGDSVDTRWGPVQVQVTVQNGTLTAVQAVVYPQNNPRDEQINSYAIPQLNSEALAAKSAQIDMVSGATYTSEGYLGSLQSALDKAGL